MLYYSQTSKTTCWRRSGNFWTIVTGWPEVNDTPYMGAVVLYRVLHIRDGAPDPLHMSSDWDAALPGIE